MDVRAEATSDRFWRAGSASRGVRRPRRGCCEPRRRPRDAVARGEGLSLVAEERDQLVGHVMFSPSLLDAPKRLSLSTGAEPDRRRASAAEQGDGTTLIRRGLELLIERLVPLAFLEGPPAYSRASGSSQGEHGFRKPSLRIPDCPFQVLRLPAYEPWMTGTLVYTEAFWRNDAVGLRDPQRLTASRLPGVESPPAASRASRSYSSQMTTSSLLGK